MKIGRNDPCPCGSGKKYKNCCLEKDTRQQADTNSTLAEFLHPDSLEALQDPQNFQNYQKYIQESQNTPQTKTFMEFMGKPNLATEHSKLLQKAINGMSFKNEGDINNFMKEWSQAQNQKPIDELLGLSAEQVSRIRYARRIDELDDIIRISTKTLPPEAAKAKIPAMSLWILNQLYQNPKGLSLTATGNFKTDFVKNMTQIFLTDDIRMKYIKRENDFYELRIVHNLLAYTDYISETKSICRLSPKGKTLLETQNTDILYRDLFSTFLLNYDWSNSVYLNYIGNDIFFIQDSAIVALRILDLYGSEKTDFSTIYSAYIRAFPIYDKPQSHQLPFNLWESTFYHLFIAVFCNNMGLVEAPPIESFEGETNIKVTPLFQRLINWVVPLPKQ